MALKYTQIPISMTEYNEKMAKIIATPRPVHETLTELLNEAAKYRIVETDCNKCKNKCKWERDSIRICADFKPKVVRKGGQKNDIKRKKK